MPTKTFHGHIRYLTTLMAHTTSKTRFALINLLLSLVLLFNMATAQTTSCSATQKCPKESPCCSSQGTCGSGALQCANGCNPMASFTAGSCQANPVCTNKNITFAPTDFNNPHKFWPILLYDGNASKAPFTLDYGSLGKGPEGVLLELTKESQTVISTTDFMLYGNVELTARNNASAGLVFAFITMSDIKDEIDWELTTANASNLETNYFSQGKTVSGTSADATAPSQDFSRSDWHTYGLNWQPDQLQWLVDGKVVRTVTQAKAADNYPRSPSRVQISMWAGGNSTNEPGVIQWAGGPIDWTSPTYTSQGFYSGEIKSFTQTCAAQNADTSVQTIGSGSNVTSYVYTGNSSSQNNEPEFVLSKNPMTYLANGAADGVPNLPGYQVQTPFTKSNPNAWDGSGDTSGLTNSEKGGASKGSSGSLGGGSSNQGGWLDNNHALSIAVPVIAGVIALLAVWGICMCICNRKRRKAANKEGILADLGRSDRQETSMYSGQGSQKERYALQNALPGQVGTRLANAGRQNKYQALGDDGDGDGYENQTSYHSQQDWTHNNSPGAALVSHGGARRDASQGTYSSISAHQESYDVQEQTMNAYGRASPYAPSAADSFSYAAQQRAQMNPRVAGPRSQYSASPVTSHQSHMMSGHAPYSPAYARSPALQPARPNVDDYQSANYIQRPYTPSQRSIPYNGGGVRHHMY